MTTTAQLITTGTKVHARGGVPKPGETTGNWHDCSMHGCGGLRVTVRWPDKTITYPCSKGMVYDGSSWQIR